MNVTPAANHAVTAPPSYNQYPSQNIGDITLLKWVTDNTALLMGSINTAPGDSGVYKLVVSVDGDMDYEQEMEVDPSGNFLSQITLGRAYKDYDKHFTIRLQKFYEDRPADEIAVSLVKKPGNSGSSVEFNSRKPLGKVSGIRGVDEWIKSQSVGSSKLDNQKFKKPDGLVVRNYKFTGHNPDEKYLGRFGRVTLYGSSCIAKYLIVKGDTEVARKILDVWCDQLDYHGGIPRSANVVGDTYISPDVRTGDMAYFLGALALYKAATGESTYDATIKRMLRDFFSPLLDPNTGLVRGGYSLNSNGYTGSREITYVTWASAEHNFDLFQSLVLLSRLFQDEDQKRVTAMYRKVGDGLDTYMWNKETGTFNRGYRFEQGADQAKALDCSSWGALYLLKQASLAAEAREPGREEFYKRRAYSALDFIDRHFKATWCYVSPEGKQGCITGYKPYAGTIDDVRDEATGIPINWDLKDDVIWSEGTLGVAIANYQMWCKSSQGRDAKRCGKFHEIVDQMVEFQSLNPTGGILYTSKRIQGHFTQGEELASLAWLGYALVIKENLYEPRMARHRRWIPW